MRTVTEQLADLQALALRQYPSQFEKGKRTEYLLEKVIEKWRELEYRMQVLPVREMNEVLDVRKLATEGERADGTPWVWDLRERDALHIPTPFARLRPTFPGTPSSDSGSKEVAG